MLLRTAQLMQLGRPRGRLVSVIRLPVRTRGVGTLSTVEAELTWTGLDFERGVTIVVDEAPPPSPQPQTVQQVNIPALFRTHVSRQFQLTSFLGVSTPTAQWCQQWQWPPLPQRPQRGAPPVPIRSVLRLCTGHRPHRRSAARGDRRDTPASAPCPSPAGFPGRRRRQLALSKRGRGGRVGL